MDAVGTVKQTHGYNHTVDCKCRFCLTASDLTGKMFGRLLVLYRDFSIKKPTWVCRCACGKEKGVRASYLLKRKTSSCGCLRAEKWPKLRAGKAPPNRLPPGRAMRNITLALYKRQAKRRGLQWALADEQFDTLTQFPCHYCGRTQVGCARSTELLSEKGHVLSKHNGDFLYNGIDRVDNSVGYTLENTVSCCKVCNRAKKDISQGDFIDYLLTAGRFQQCHSVQSS